MSTEPEPATDAPGEREERLFRADAIRDLYHRHIAGSEDNPGVDEPTALELTRLVVMTMVAEGPGGDRDDGPIDGHDGGPGGGDGRFVTIGPNGTLLDESGGLMGYEAMKARALVEQAVGLAQAGMDLNEVMHELFG